MGLLEKKVALITGGARGIGRAHAVTCAREGADVVVFDVPGQPSTGSYELATQNDIDETVELVEKQGRRAIAVRGDVRSQADLDGAVALTLQKFGKIDILIANAGVWDSGNFWEISEEQWERVLGINLGGAWRSAKAVAPAMIERQSGSIVFVASINSLEAGPRFAHYAAAKHGVLGLMKSVAVELAPHGIRCNAVCPGPTPTVMGNNQASWDLFAGHAGGTEAEMLDAAYGWLALKGFNSISPQASADAALFLNSDLAASVTGVAVPVDAGHLVLPGTNPAPVKH
jgi:SDR family mycofactocin-dependent oxidoreductase